MSASNPPDPFQATRDRVNEMELPEVPKRYEKSTVLLFFFHLFFVLLCLFYPYSDGQPNWLGLWINALFMGLQVFKFYMRWKSVTGLERIVKHAETLKRIINTPIYTHDEENKTITINFLYVLTPDQLDELKRKTKHARSQRS